MCDFRCQCTHLNTDAVLDPLRVLRALGDDTPLSMALAPVACMLRERTHRRRVGLITRNLQRTLNLDVAARRAERRVRLLLCVLCPQGFRDDAHVVAWVVGVVCQRV